MGVVRKAESNLLRGGEVQVISFKNLCIYFEFYFCSLPQMEFEDLFSE